MRKRFWLCVLAVAVASVPPAVSAPTDPPAPAPAQPPPATAPPCTSPEHRQLDFWVGTWNVTNSKGEPAGINRIEKILDGCVLQENWQGQRGGQATSLSLYNAIDKKWQQMRVNSRGDVVFLAGGLREGKMEMTGTWTHRSGDVDHLKVTWEPLADDGVRQVMVSSSDGGKTWTTVFDDVSRRKPVAAPTGP
jgi:hypothetical protein